MTSDPTVGRRRFLGAMAAAGVAAACSDDGPTGATGGSVEAGTVADLPDDPFTLGVASGDPTASSVILWTRLALDPTVADGAMPAQRVSVEWEVATDEEFRDVVAGGTAAAVGPTAHSVHVDADGLPPDSWYWYRFSVGAWTSPVGRTRTVPEPGAPTSTASIAHVSCQRIDLSPCVYWAWRGSCVVTGRARSKRLRRHFRCCAIHAPVSSKNRRRLPG